MLIILIVVATQIQKDKTIAKLFPLMLTVEFIPLIVIIVQEI